MHTSTILFRYFQNYAHIRSFIYMFKNLNTIAETNANWYICKCTHRLHVCRLMSYIFTNTCIPNQLIKHTVQALVLTLLDYCSSERNMTRLQVARNEVAGLVLRCPYQTNARTMNHHLAWLSVESRVQYSLI